jgi:recombination protein RecA
MFDEGISRTGELIDLGIEHTLLERSGTWISYGSDRLGQGRENARRTLRENADLTDRLEGEVRGKLGLVLETPRGSVAADSEAAARPAPVKGGAGGRKRETVEEKAR